VGTVRNRYRCCGEVRYATAVSEETLPGGNTDGAVRIGGIVHKRAAPWTPTVHALLRHLERAGPAAFTYCSTPTGTTAIVGTLAR
jgi:hypothetical protein